MRIGGVDIGLGSYEHAGGETAGCFVLTGTVGMTEYIVWIDKEDMSVLKGEGINGEWFDLDDDEAKAVYAALLYKLMAPLADGPTRVIGGRYGSL